jgi:hypothetical protein
MRYAPKGDQFRKKYNYLRIHYESCIFLSLKTPVPYSPSDFQNLLYIPQDRPNNGKWNDTGYRGIRDPKVSVRTCGFIASPKGTLLYRYSFQLVQNAVKGQDALANGI